MSDVEIGEGFPAFVEAPALLATGVGGYIIRTDHGVQRVIRFVTPSGEILNVYAATPEVLEGMRTTAQDLQLAELETGGAMRDLGLYREG
jgi:hypothetical protein